MTYKKAFSVLEYSFLIAMVVGALLGMQVYLKRSMQSQLQATGDTLADPYSFGLTNLNENFRSHSRSTAWAFPGPVNITRTYDAHWSVRSDRTLGPLSTEEEGKW
jgi:hypothetical protein